MTLICPHILAYDQFVFDPRILDVRKTTSCSSVASKVAKMFSAVLSHDAMRCFPVFYLRVPFLLIPEQIKCFRHNVHTYKALLLYYVSVAFYPCVGLEEHYILCDTLCSGYKTCTARNYTNTSN